MDNYDNYFKTNQELWNKKTPVHVASDFYSNEAFLSGANSIDDIVLNEIGNVDQKKLLHLQCHFGQDTLSLARMGAQVTGIDLSDESIRTARKQNEKIGLDAQFLHGNVYDTIQLTNGAKFDFIFTSYGTICWLPDLDLWAKIIADSLVEGGSFYMADFHPTLLMYDFVEHKIAYHHDNQQKPYEEIEAGTYSDRDADIHQKEFFWNHSSQEVINALINQGLSLKFFNEHYHSPYNCFENMKEVSPGKYVYGSLEYRLPHVFSMMWQK